MIKFKSLFRNITLLNVILLGVILLMAVYILLPQFNFVIQYSLPVREKTTTEEHPISARSNYPSPSDYVAIADENLFHPERKIPPEKKEEPKLPQPEFILYGTLITEDLSLAYIEDIKTPVSSPGRGKRQSILKKGSAMSGYTLKEVEADKIVMAKGDESLTLYVRDPQRPKQRDSMATAPGQSAKPASASFHPKPNPVQQILDRKREPVIPATDVKEKDLKVFEMLNRMK
jgi:hypothetical protein